MPDQTIHVNLLWQFERVYLRSANIDVHGTPELFDMKWQPKIEMNIAAQGREVGDNRFDVTLTLTLSCKNRDMDAVNIKLEQCALIRILQELDNEAMQRIISVEVPNALFPYVREATDNLIVRSTMPPLTLAPVHFEKVLEEGFKRLKQDQRTISKPPASGKDEVLN